MHRFRSARRAPILVLLLACAAPAHAATRTWPGPAPCATTLAACIAASAAGDTVEIATDGPIDESIDYVGAVSVVAAHGYRPVLAAGRNVTVGIGEPTPWSVRLAGLTLTDGAVAVYPTTSGALSIERVEVLDVPGTYGITVSPFAPLALDLAIVACRTHVSGKSSIGIYVPSRADAALSARFTDNRIYARGNAPLPLAGLPGRRGIVVQLPAGLTDTVDVARNAVLPDPLSTGPLARLSAGINVGVGDNGGEANVRVVDNVVVLREDTTGFASAVRVTPGGTTRLRIDHNTLTGGGEGIRVQTFATPTVSGTIDANLTAFHAGHGIAIFPSTLESGVTNSRNAVFANGSNAYTPGPGTITSDPMIESVARPRLLPGSPLLDAADFSLRLVPGPGALAPPAILDADGLRRFRGAAASNLDVGAYERGDATLRFANPAASSFVALPDPALDGDPLHRLQVTRTDGSPNTVPLTTFYASGINQWRIVADDAGTIPADAGFFVFAPAPGFSSSIHRATASNTSGDTTTLGNPYSNLPASQVFLVSGYRNALSFPNPHPIAAAHVGGAWRIVNLDGTPMLQDMRFSVYAQEPSPNAYVHTVAAQAARSELDHVLLNGYACARPVIGALASNGVENAHYAAVRHDPVRGRWYVANEDGALLPAGAQFAVVVDPRVHEETCGPLLFGDGFD